MATATNDPNLLLYPNVGTSQRRQSLPWHIILLPWMPTT